MAGSGWVPGSRSGKALRDLHLEPARLQGTGRSLTPELTPSDPASHLCCRSYASADLVLCCAPGVQLGSKGYGDPVTFDNTYYKTLLAAPWTDKKNEMAQHTGGWLAGWGDSGWMGWWLAGLDAVCGG